MGEAELSGVCFRFKDDLSFVVHEKKLLSLAEFAHMCCTVHGVANFELANHQLVQKQYPTRTLISYSHALILKFEFCFFVCLEFSEATDGEAGLPAPYRYSVSPAENGKCNVFMPNALTTADTRPQPWSFSLFSTISYDVLRWLCVRHASIGAAFVGHMDKLPKTKTASVVWEVQPRCLIILYFTNRILAGQAVSICTSLSIAVCSREVKVQTGPGAAKIFGVKPKIYLTGSVTLPPDSWAKVS